MKTEEKPDWSTLAKRLKWAREKRGLSQAEVAKNAGVAQGTIGNLESGERKSARKLLDIAAAVQVQPAWLESGKGEWQVKKGAVFQELDSGERELLEHWRNLLGKDRQKFLKDIVELARERQAEREELFAQAGVTRIAEQAAHATKARSAKATAEISRQRPLDLGPASRRIRETTK